MLLNALLVVLSSQCVWARKSEPSFDEAEAGFFRGSDKYDFAIEVPAAEVECFWHFAHQSGSFYLMYLVRIFRPVPARSGFISSAKINVFIILCMVCLNA